MQKQKCLNGFVKRRYFLVFTMYGAGSTAAAFAAICQIGFGEFGSGSVFDHQGNTIPHLPLQRAEIDHLVEL